MNLIKDIHQFMFKQMGQDLLSTFDTQVLCEFSMQMLAWF